MLLDEARGQKLFDFYHGLPWAPTYTPVRSCPWLPLPCPAKMPRTSICGNFRIQHLAVFSLICLKDNGTALWLLACTLSWADSSVLE